MAKSKIVSILRVPCPSLTTLDEPFVLLELLNELCDRCCRSKCQSNALKLVNCQLEESHASDFVCFDDVDLVVVEKILFRVGLKKLHNSSRTPTFDVSRKVIR